MALPSLIKGPVKVRQLVMFAAATAEFVDIHYDHGWAVEKGLPDVIVQGWFKTAIIAQMLKDWVGDGEALKRLTVQHRGMDVAGNTLTAGGKVLRVVPEGSAMQVECEVWVENQQGQRTTTGTALVVLS